MWKHLTSFISAFLIQNSIVLLPVTERIHRLYKFLFHSMYRRISFFHFSEGVIWKCQEFAKFSCFSKCKRKRKLLQRVISCDLWQCHIHAFYLVQLKLHILLTLFKFCLLSFPDDVWKGVSCKYLRFCGTKGSKYCIMNNNNEFNYLRHGMNLCMKI